MDDEKSLLGSRPLLDEPLDFGSETGYAERSVWRSNANGTRREDDRRLKIIIVALSVAYIPLLVLYLILFTHLQSSPSLDSVRPSGLFPSLSSSQAIKYEQRHLRVQLHNNPFAGAPRPELDAAWHELFEGTAPVSPSPLRAENVSEDANLRLTRIHGRPDIRINVTQQDLAYYNLTSIPLADGSGYAAELGVHHELHCLKKIRHWIHRDYYLKNETEAELVEWKAHIDHCMEMMRESIICRGDASLSTFKWVAGDPPRLTAVAQGHHECVNWDSMMGWVRDRAVPIFEPGVLKRPEEM